MPTGHRSTDKSITTPAASANAAVMRQSRSVLPLAIGVIVLTLLAAGAQIVNERTRSIELWRSTAEADSRTIAAHALQTLQAADLVLRSVTDQANSYGLHNAEELRKRLGTAEIHEMLKDRRSGLPQVSVASIVDENGDMVNFTRNHPPRSANGSKINLSERDYFRAHKQNPDLDLFLSEAVQNKGTGTWTFYLARKIKSREGQMIGVVLAGIESAYFHDFYRAIGSPGKVVTVYHSNGAPLARWPEDTPGMGVNFNRGKAFEVLRSGQRSAIVKQGAVGTLESNAAEMRILAPSAITEYPVVVNVRISEDLILSSWKRGAFTTIAIALVLSAVTLTLGIALRTILRRNAEALSALEEATGRANAATAAKGEFIATMSHEIRTPMNGVVGVISLLQRTRLDAEQKQLVDTASSSADALLRVVNEVLDFSRIDAGAQPVHVAPFSVRKLALDTITVARSYPGADALKVDYRIAENTPDWLLGDENLVARVLINLLTNAVKYTQQGRVALDISVVSLEPAACTMDFRVTDTGKGIPEHLRERIFAPFDQGEEGRLRPHSGSGLGLAICRRITDTLGGSIKLESKVGEGSTFTFRLTFGVTATVPSETVPASAASTDAAPSHRLRVLVAEDTPASQLVIRLILEKIGHTVRVASDGSEAVRLFSAEIFDLVFMDIQMPAMDGYAATRIIRAIETERNSKRNATARKIPIYGLSAFAQNADRELAYQAGMDGYVPKPVKTSDVEAVLASVAPAEHPESSMDGSEGEPKKVPPAGDVLQVSHAELNDLALALGSEGFAAAIGHFETDLRSTVSRLEQALSRQDSVETRKAAHRIKGLLLQFGVPALASRLAQLEAASRALSGAADYPSASELCAQCLAAIGAVATASAVIIEQVKAGESS